MRAYSPKTKRRTALSLPREAEQAIEDDLRLQQELAKEILSREVEAKKDAALLRMIKKTLKNFKGVYPHQVDGVARKLVLEDLHRLAKLSYKLMIRVRDLK